MTETRRPELGARLGYRGKEGRQAGRAAIVTATMGSLEQEGVDAGDVPALSSPTHVHLWVYTPSPKGGFVEYDVPYGEPGEDGMIPPGSWCWLYESPWRNDRGD